MPIFDYTQNSTGITSYTAGDGISIQGNSIIDICKGVC